MINIENITLLDLLPSSIKQDPTIIAISKSLEKYMKENIELRKRLNFMNKIDEIEDGGLLDALAYQFHVDFYEHTLSLEKKRKLIKSSMANHKTKGTRSALEKVLKIVFGDPKLEEWFEYGGEPFFFRVNINVTEEGISENSLLRAEQLINAYKNTRSWLETINVYLTNQSNIYIGMATVSGEEITVYPYSPRNIESKGNIYVGLGSNTGVENMTVYPRKEVI